MRSLSRVRLLATPWTAAYQAPLSMGFSRQKYWSGVPLPSPRNTLQVSKFFLMSGYKSRGRRGRDFSPPRIHHLRSQQSECERARLTEVQTPQFSVSSYKVGVSTIPHLICSPRRSCESHMRTVCVEALCEMRSPSHVLTGLSVCK